jgi:hypothetical protein
MIFKVNKQNFKLRQICIFLLLILFLFPTLSWAQTYGTVTGHIYASDGTTPVVGANILFYDVAATTCSSGGTAVSTPIITTDLNGYYNSLELPVGSYYMRVNKDVAGSAPWFMNEWYNGGANGTHTLCDDNGVILATPIIVTAGQTTPGINSAMTNAGKISGTVTSGGGLGSVTIKVYDALCADSPITIMGTTAAGIQTDGSGYYEILVPVGTVYVQTSDTPSLLDEYYNAAGDAYNCKDAEGVIVADSQTAINIDFTLIAGNLVSGTAFIDNTTNTIEGITVSLQTVKGGNIDTWEAATAANGTWQITVPPGTYYATVRDGDNTIPYYPEWYTGPPASGDITGTTDSTLASSIDATGTLAPIGIDFHLSMGARIAGTVNDALTNLAISKVCIRAYTDDTCPKTTVSTFSGRETTTDASGQYTMVLNPGIYYFNTNTIVCGTPEPYDEWWSGSWADNTTDCSGALAVQVFAGDVETIDFDLVRTVAAPAASAAPNVMNVILMSSGPFVAGSVIEIAASLSNVVWVKGTPHLILNMGGVPVIAYYSSGSGTNTLTFQYTVVAGDDISSMGYWSEWGLELNGGQIYTNEGIDVDLVLPVPGAPGSLGANMTAGVLSTVYPVYRFYSPGLLKHFFTVDENEKESLIANAADVWQLEIAPYSVFLPQQYNAATQDQKNTLIAVNRFYSAALQTHLYTIDENETAHLIANAADVWQSEGPVFYVPIGNPAGTIPVYRFYSDGLKVHLFTVDENEMNHLIDTAGDVWNFEGVAYHAYPSI